jgi:hypothetical protein
VDNISVAVRGFTQSSIVRLSGELRSADIDITKDVSWVSPSLAHVSLLTTLVETLSCLAGAIELICHVQNVITGGEVVVVATDDRGVDSVCCRSEAWGPGLRADWSNSEHGDLLALLSEATLDALYFADGLSLPAEECLKRLRLPILRQHVWITTIGCLVKAHLSVTLPVDVYLKSVPTG